MSNSHEIDLRELLYYVLKKWRVIVIAALTVAVIAGAGKLVSLMSRNSSDAAKLSSADEKALTTLTEEMDELQTELSGLSSQIEYNENSVLMKIDPLNKYVGSFKIYLDPSASNQSIDITGRLAMAYAAYLSSDEFFDYVFDNTESNADMNKDVRYLKELLNVSADVEAATVSVSYIGDNEARVQETIAVVKQAVYDEYPEIRRIIGNHDCSIIMESLYSTVDQKLADTQKENLQVVADCENAVSEKQAEIDAITNTGSTSKVSVKRAVFSAVKNAIVGGVVGIILTMFCYMLAAVLSRKMWSSSAWQSFSIPVIAEIFTEKEHRRLEKFDNWLAKLMGFAAPKTSFDESAALTAAYISAMLREKGAASSAIVVEAEKELCDKTMAAMNKAESNAFTVVGDILTDPNAVSELEKVKDVVLLADGEKITIDEVRRIAVLLDVWGKKLHGVILVK